LCDTCQEGPEGTPGGCGHCKFCSPAACPPPECVGAETTVATASGNGAQQLATPTISATNSNLKGRVLVLDVNSWEESDGAEKLPRDTTAVRCASMCKSTAGCNAWTFCYKPEGCGMENECTLSEQGDTPADRMMCTALGPFKKCTAKGRFPFLMCSLKRVDKPDVAGALEYYPNSTDWTSGMVNEQAAPSSMSQDQGFPITQRCRL
jgi:hypothetical protein